MSNSFSFSSLVAQTMTDFFIQKSPLFNTANRDYVEEIENKSYATHGSINIKIPGAPSVQTGLTVTATGIQDLVVPYTVTEDDLYSVTRSLDLLETKFDIVGGEGALTKDSKKAVVDNYCHPAFSALEGQLELTAASRLKTTAYFSPIDGIEKLSSINTYSAISSVESLCEKMKLPGERYLMMNVDDAQAVTDSLQNMMNPMINGNITKTARVGGPDKGRLASFDMYRSTELLPHTAGALALMSGITVSSVSADGTQITLTGVPSTTSQLINAGDRISIPSVYVLSPINFNQLSTRLVVTAAADANGNGSGSVTVTLSFPLLASGEHANVSALPANGAAVTVFPDHKVNYAYVRSGLSAVPLTLGDIYGAKNSDTKSSNGKVPVKVVLQGAALDFQNIFRISMLVAIQAIAPYTIAVPSLV